MLLKKKVLNIYYQWLKDNGQANLGDVVAVVGIEDEVEIEIITVVMLVLDSRKHHPIRTTTTTDQEAMLKVDHMAVVWRIITIAQNDP